MYLKIRRDGQETSFDFYIDDRLYAGVWIKNAYIESLLEYWVDECKRKYGGENV